MNFIIKSEQKNPKKQKKEYLRIFLKQKLKVSYYKKITEKIFAP